MMLKGRKKKKHRAKRRGRRHNPSPVLFANPRKRRRKRRAKAKRAHITRRRRRSNPRALIRYSAPRRRRRAKRHHGLKLHRRRRNPSRLRLGSLKGTIRIALFGGLGIASANVGRYLYGKYLSGTVKGSGGTVRDTIDQVLSVASMGLMTYAVEKGLRKVPGVKHEDCNAFRIAGYAAMGWKGLGVVVKKLRPTANLEQWGMAGMAGIREYGMGFDAYSQFGYDAGGELEDQGVENADAFMGELEDSDSFQGLESTSSFLGAAHGRGRGAHHHGPFAR